MVRVNPDGQNIVFVALMLAWFGGSLVAGFRWYWALRTYLRRFAGIFPIFAYEPFFVSPMFFPYALVQRLEREPEPNPELERLRRAIPRRFRYYLMWVFGLPVIIAGLLAFLIVSGLVAFTR